MAKPKQGMSSDGLTPPPCDQEIFEKGEPVAALDAASNAAERWVKSVAARAEARLDWHYSGGRAQVLHLGDASSRARVMMAIDELENSLEGTILTIYRPGDSGLYRAGVTPAPEGALASFPDDRGNAVFMIEANHRRRD